MTSPHLKLDASLPHVQFYLTTTAPMLVGATWATYLLPEMANDMSSPEQWQQDINESWGLETRTDLYRMIWRLAMMDVHGDDWHHHFIRYRCNSANEWRSSLTMDGNPTQIAEQKFMDMVAKLVGEEGFYAWDFVRGSYLTRAGLYTGWVPEADAIYLLNVISHQAQRHFRSWETYIRSYLCGRALWAFHCFDAEERLEHINSFLSGDIKSGFNSMAKFYHHFESDERCPLHWMKWNIFLPEMSAPQSLQDVMNAKNQEVGVSE